MTWVGLSWQSRPLSFCHFSSSCHRGRHDVIGRIDRHSSSYSIHQRQAEGWPLLLAVRTFLLTSFFFIPGNRVRVQKGRKCTHFSSCQRQFPHVSSPFLATHLESRNKETWMEMFRSVSIENKGFHRGLPASFVSLLEFVKGSRCRAPLLRLIHQQDGSFLHLPNWTVIVVEVGGGNIRFELSFASSISSTRERRKKREKEKQEGKKKLGAKPVTVWKGNRESKKSSSRVLYPISIPFFLPSNLGRNSSLRDLIL